MSLNDTMARLREDPPRWNYRQMLALALMRSERQIGCTNCIHRYRPCRLHLKCKADDRLLYFEPKALLMEMQMSRVDAVINAINELSENPKKQ